eukprot:758704-Hanusia_phi.AAC.4
MDKEQLEAGGRQAGNGGRTGEEEEQGWNICVESHHPFEKLGSVHCILRAQVSLPSELRQGVEGQEGNWRSKGGEERAGRGESSQQLVPAAAPDTLRASTSSSSSSSSPTLPPLVLSLTPSSGRGPELVGLAFASSAPSEEESTSGRGSSSAHHRSKRGSSCNWRCEGRTRRGQGRRRGRGGSWRKRWGRRRRRDCTEGSQRGGGRDSNSALIACSSFFISSCSFARSSSSQNEWRRRVSNWQTKSLRRSWSTPEPRR